MNELLENVSASQVRLGHAVTEHLSKAIFEGRLKPGDPLPSELQIANAFGVSKQVAREAIRELSALGVVEISQGRQSRVCETRPEQLSKFFKFTISGDSEGLNQAVELRRIIEVPVARLAATRRTEEQLEIIDQQLLRMEESLACPEEWAGRHMEFHCLLAEASQNRLLVYQLEALRPLILDLDRALTEPLTEIDRATFVRHVAIVDAVRAGDPDAAADAMITHFGAMREMSQIGPGRFQLSEQNFEKKKEARETQ